MVGAAVVRGGRLISLGYHARFGGEHAEVMALRRAGRRARGATLFVTLEPCAHRGKTPPCVEAILAAGVTRVVAAMGDPHSLVNGRGFRALRRAGVRIAVGLLAAEAERLNEAYATAIRERRPLVTLKAGMTLDGRIATAARESRYITSAASRRAARRLRRDHDAVLVGAATALEDDPRLSARGDRGGRQPLRAILDSRLRLSPASRILRSRGGKVILYAVRPAAGRRRLLERAGAEVVAAGGDRGRVRLRRVLHDLARRGVQSLLVEGGGEVAWSFLEAGLADRIAFFVAPRIVGGLAAVPVVGGGGVRRLVDAIRVDELQILRVGEDLLLTGRVSRGRRVTTAKRRPAAEAARRLRLHGG